MWTTTPLSPLLVIETTAPIHATKGVPEMYKKGKEMATVHVQDCQDALYVCADGYNDVHDDTTDDVDHPRKNRLQLAPLNTPYQDAAQICCISEKGEHHCRYWHPDYEVTGPVQNELGQTPSQVNARHNPSETYAHRLFDIMYLIFLQQTITLSTFVETEVKSVHRSTCKPYNVVMSRMRLPPCNLPVYSRNLQISNENSCTTTNPDWYCNSYH